MRSDERIAWRGPLKEQDRRNLSPHKPAVIAMWLWSREYALQRGGVMDFWDKLPELRKKLCRECLDKIEKAQDE